MLFFDFDPFGGFIMAFSDVIDMIINIYIIILPYMKNIFATIFLIMGILLIYKIFFKRRKNVKIKTGYYQPIIPETLLGIFYIILAWGLYFDFILMLIINISELAPPPLIFYIIESLGYSGFADIFVPLTSEWQNLNNLQLLGMLFIGTISILGFILLIYGILVFINKDLKGKKNSFGSIIGGFAIILILGLSPGASLLLINSI